MPCEQPEAVQGGLELLIVLKIAKLLILGWLVESWRSNDPCATQTSDYPQHKGLCQP